MLDELFASAGDGASIRPPFYCDHGDNIRLGSGVFLHFGCMILDVARVSIGDMTQIGPGVQILIADHPRHPEPQRQGLEFGRPICIGANVWIEGGALLMPGMTVGDDATVGAGAVVDEGHPGRSHRRRHSGAGSDTIDREADGRQICLTVVAFPQRSIPKPIGPCSERLHGRPCQSPSCR